MRRIIFITGLPRSGTKLLRDLMNQHSMISIPRIETVLFPYLVNKYGLGFDLNQPDNFELVKSEIEKSTFYQNFLKHGLSLDLKTAVQEADLITWALLFEALLKFYGPKEYHEELIIGDKTPGYIDHTDLLLNIWPQAKFVHIVRDPRDYLCSVNQVWNKNIYRAANRWNQTMVNLEHRERLNDQNMLTVYYEQLLEQPENTLISICNFIGINFEASMLTLNESSELFGDAKGSTTIVRGNRQKYRQKLSKQQIYKIEQLVCPGARMHGYQLDNPEVKPKKLSQLSLLKHKYTDGLNALMFHIRNKGLLNGSKYFFKLNQTNIKRSL